MIYTPFYTIHNTLNSPADYPGTVIPPPTTLITPTVTPLCPIIPTSNLLRTPLTPTPISKDVPLSRNDVIRDLSNKELASRDLASNLRDLTTRDFLSSQLLPNHHEIPTTRPSHQESPTTPPNHQESPRTSPKVEFPAVSIELPISSPQQTEVTHGPVNSLPFQ